MKIFLGKAALVCGLLFTSFLVVAQQSFPTAYFYGSLTLEDGQELRGLLSYDMHSDGILMETDKGKYLSFHASKIHHFTFEDPKIKMVRTFFALPIANATDYESIRLFEVLYEGRLTLLARPRTLVESTEDNEAADSQHALDNRLELPFEFYFLKEEGMLTRYTPGQSRLLNFMDWRYREVKKYIRKNRLREEYIADLVRITAYYNALK